LNKERIYIGVFICSLLAFAVFEWLKPRPVDWTESYSGLDKVPYGCYIMRDMLPQLFDADSLSYQNEPIFTAEWDSTQSKNYIYINGSFSPDKYEAGKLIEQLEHGNNIFIAAHQISGKLADTLSIDIDQAPPINPINDPRLSRDTVAINFLNPTLQADSAWQYTVGIRDYHFSDFDTLNTTILGITQNADANFIRITRGKGALFLHTMPKAFSNYHMLNKEKADYAFMALSYLPVRPTVWDEYYKYGRQQASSPMRYIVSHDSLRWGWFTALAGLFLFMIFRAKRKQRIIPDIQQPENKTLQFTQTIGRLYHEHGNRKDIAQKKITYFLSYIRSHLRLDPEPFNNELIQTIAQRSGIEDEQVTALFNQISAIQNKSAITAADLQTLNHQIELFYQQTSR